MHILLDNNWSIVVIASEAKQSKNISELINIYKKNLQLADFFTTSIFYLYIIYQITNSEVRLYFYIYIYPKMDQEYIPHSY